MAATAATFIWKRIRNDNTLLRYRYNREFHAERGGHGEGSDCHGRSGEDMS